MLDFGAIVDTAKEVLMPAAEEALEGVDELIPELDDVFPLDEFGTEGLW